MIELNLLPEVKKEFIRAQRTRNTVISTMILTTIVAGGLTFLSAGFVLIAQPKLNELKTKDINTQLNELRKINEIDKYLTVQNQLNNIQGLHDGRANYSRLFGYLRQLNPAVPHNVALSTALVSELEGGIKIEGTARNFEAVNVFKNTLENAKLTYKAGDKKESTQLFETVTLSEASLAELNGVSLAHFTMQLTYTDKAFAVDTIEPNAEIPALITSDGDRNAPKEVFGSSPEGVQ